MALADRLMDATIVPGFSSLGYRARRGGWAPTPDLTGRSYLVTGASSGLGAACCGQLAGAGASVHMVVRSPDKGEDVRARISERTGSDSLRVWRCDVSEPESIAAFAREFEAAGEPLDALVNNAGVMPPERVTNSAGIELSFATNVLGPFALTRALLGPLTGSRDARVVNVSSGGAYGAKLDGEDLQLTDRDYDPNRFYAHTKRCEIVLAELWQERQGSPTLSFHSTHPGWADTPGVQDSLPGFRRVMGPLLRDAEQGADTMAWLCWADEPVREPGRFWHDRRPRPTHRVPWTRESDEARAALWAECEQLAGAGMNKTPMNERG